MEQMEKDLGTQLDWVAVDHYNTAHPHTHIVLRGKDDKGDDLIIAREYIAHGMRERAAEIVSLDLGPAPTGKSRAVFSMRLSRNGSPALTANCCETRTQNDSCRPQTAMLSGRAFGRAGFRN